jgi:hypothetical protein
VLLCDVEQRFLDRGLQTGAKNLDREAAKNKITAGDKVSKLGRVTAVVRRAKLADCDLVIEARRGLRSRRRFSAIRKKFASAVRFFLTPIANWP